MFVLIYLFVYLFTSYSMPITLIGSSTKEIRKAFTHTALLLEFVVYTSERDRFYL